ncbi:hypothetical protein BJ875DRAFT_482547 [Amylocarpus encephaloides]|uniref:Uncharacterized protein n=1 Tax=Amylocarpus encephaloides TaxID=45428 RepID=A0A9P7YM58_9HELO|nr:hypothetical protein BJ875DRAFT_482547 [Amylocarpus encephaloides]
MAPAGYDSYRGRDHGRYQTDSWPSRSPPRGSSSYSSRLASRRESQDYGARSPRGDPSKDSGSPRHTYSPLGTQGTATRPPAPPYLATKELFPEKPPEKAITPIENTAPKLIQATLVEVFAQIGHNIVDVALLKHKRNAAKFESEKRANEYQKNKDIHQKYPSVEESQRKARESSERTVESSSKALDKKTSDLNESFATNAAKLWSTLSTVVEKATVQESSRQHKELEEQIKAQKHTIDQQASNYEELQAQVSKLQKVVELPQQNVAKATDVTELKQRQETLDGRIMQHSTTLTQANQSLSNLKQLVGSLEIKAGNASTFAQDLEGKFTTLDSVTKQVNGNLERVEENSKGLSATFDVCKAEYAKILGLVHASVTKLADQDILKEKVETLEAQAYEIEKSIDRIQNLSSTPATTDPESGSKIARLEEQLSDFGQRLTSIGESIESGTALAKVGNVLSTSPVVESAIELGTKGTRQRNTQVSSDVDKRFERFEQEIRLSIDGMEEVAAAVTAQFDIELTSLKAQLQALQSQAHQPDPALSSRVDLLEQKSNSLERESNALDLKLTHHNNLLAQRLDRASLHCEANGVAITGLDSRFNNLTTSEVYQAMSTLATTNYDAKLGSLEEEYKLLENRINNVGAVVLIDCNERMDKLIAEVRAELETKSTYLSTSFKDMNDDFQKLLAVPTDTRQGGASSVKRAVTNGYFITPTGRNLKRQRTVSGTNSDGDAQPDTGAASAPK